MAVVDDRKVRFVLKTISNHLTSPPGRPPNTASSTTNDMSGSGKGVVHGTSQYINGTLVSEIPSPLPKEKDPKVTSKHSHKGSSTCAMLLDKIKGIPTTKKPEETPKMLSIMKKPNSPTATVKSEREPTEKKLVTFTNLVQYEDDYEEHSEGNSKKNNGRARDYKTIPRTKVIARTNMIASTTEAKNKSFNKLKGVKSVGGRYNQAFAVIPDSGLPSFKILFDKAMNGIPAERLPTNARITANNACKSNLLPAINDNRNLKVPKSKCPIISSGQSGLAVNKGHPRRCEDPSLRIPSKLECNSECLETSSSVVSLKESDEKVLVDSAVLEEFWSCVRNMQKIRREDRHNLTRCKKNVMYLSELKNTMMMDDYR